MRTRGGATLLAITFAAASLLAADVSGAWPSTRGRPRPTSTTTTTTTAVAVADPGVLAAGDIASCGSTGDEATAALLDARPSATVITLGDDAYERGTAAEYASCYGPTWGRNKARTRPVPGNHEYATAGATGYYDYFGALAGDRSKGYYSYDLGAWHVIALNSNCTVVSCQRGGAQEQWLRADLAAHRTLCTLAYWHHPRFSSGSTHGSSTAVAPLWQALYDGNADVILAGHEHDYERFAPLDPSGAVDVARGLRSFVVGTGGRSHYGFGTPLPGSEVRSSSTFGILQLTLHARAFDWRFVPIAGQTFTDEGTQTCH